MYDILIPGFNIIVSGLFGDKLIKIRLMRFQLSIP